MLRTIIFLVLFLAAFATAEGTVARPSINGKLHVEGTVLRDAKGNLAVLKELQNLR